MYCWYNQLSYYFVPDVVVDWWYYFFICTLYICTWWVMYKLMFEWKFSIIFFFCIFYIFNLQYSLYVMFEQCFWLRWMCVVGSEELLFYRPQMGKNIHIRISVVVDVNILDFYLTKYKKKMYTKFNSYHTLNNPFCIITLNIFLWKIYINISKRNNQFYDRQYTIRCFHLNYRFI